MIPNEILIKLANATAPQLEAVKAALEGKPTTVEADIRTISPTAAAKRLNVSRTSVYNLINRGALSVVTLGGGERRVSMASLIEYAAGKRMSASAAK